MLPNSMASSCDAKISAMLTALGSCTRIKHCPPPFAYIVHFRREQPLSSFTSCVCWDGMSYTSVLCPRMSMRACSIGRCCRALRKMHTSSKGPPVTMNAH